MSEAVTVSFADAEQGWFGMARLGEKSALAVLFRGRELAGVLGEDGPLTMSDAGVSWTGDVGFDLAIEPISGWIERPDVREQLVRVRGEVRAGGISAQIDAPGQRGETLAVADWSELDLVRTVSAWLGDGGIVLESHRPAKAKGHDAEEVWAALVEHGEPVPIADPRLSTTYDGDGHQRRAGLELWTTDEDGYPIRAGGEVICGSSLDLDDLVLDLAFFRWRAEGTEGVGRYDILRKP